MRDFDKVKKEYQNKKMYFNRYEFVKIVEKSKIDPYGSIIEFEKYFEKYPDDNSARTYYTSNLIAIGKFEEAEKELEKLEYLLKKKGIYSFDENRAKALSHCIKLSRLKLYLYQNRNEEAMNLFFSNYDELSYLGKEILFYFNKLRGVLDPKRRTPNSYMFRQIVEYKEDDFREHIKKHLADYNENDRNISVSYFNPDFPIDKAIEEIKKNIPSDKRLCQGYIENMYIFKFDQCGRDNNKLVDYFKVYTFSNTQNFITMCPSDNCTYYPYVDLNYLKEKEEEKTLVKRPSQIDKFRQRYNIK